MLKERNFLETKVVRCFGYCIHLSAGNRIFEIIQQYACVVDYNTTIELRVRDDSKKRNR